MDGKVGRGVRRLHLGMAIVVATLLATSAASAAPCLIFVHGKQTDTNTFTNWTAALDSGHENHDDERNDADRDTRKAIPTGIWMCGSTPCAANTTVQSAMSSAQLVGVLY